MLPTILFSLLGFLAGSVLFSQVYAYIFHQSDITVNAMDHNPGVYNAFRNGGLYCGLFTLAGDLLKGFLPVFLYLHMVPFAASHFGLAFVMVSPVLGTIVPLFRHFRGGKGITVSFGALLGLLPMWQPLALLAILFLVFSCILIVNPHYYRTLCTFILFGIGVMMLQGNMNELAGCLFIAMVVSANLLLKPETLEKFSVEPVWKR